mmetsp:Transcript_5563/g.7883  ORF Transcript_5563/g.7883 Transcript_5563/m.7883 type:complete len:172 (+) Transcript_5563:156-671(+)
MPLDEEDAKALKNDNVPLPAIVKTAMEYCWSNDFLDIFRKYFREHASSFVGYPSKGNMEAAEHTLEHWDIFQNYLKLYENTLGDWLHDQGINQTDFYSDIQKVQRTTADPKVQEFVYCLLASCDYDSFYSVMVREATRLADTRPTVAEAKNDDFQGDEHKGALDKSTAGEK